MTNIHGLKVQDILASTTLLADFLKDKLADGQKKLLKLAKDAIVNATNALSINNQFNSGLYNHYVMTKLIK